MLVYRITKRKRASDLSGTGAALYPGRWNKQGTPVLYTGESKEIALLENIVHLPPMMAPQLDLLTIAIPDKSMSVLEAKDLPSNWSQYPAPTVLSEIGQRWIEEGKTLALQVPSCIIYSAHNILLNCRHRLYPKVRIMAEEPFAFDARLSKA